MATMSRTMLVRVNNEIKVDVFAGLPGEYQVVSINIGAAETRGLYECSREEATEIKEERLRSADGDFGPVLVTVEYQVAPEEAADFLKAVRQYKRIRRRDGAQRWGIFHDMENAHRYVESFIVASWAEHLRQHERFTRADRETEERVQRYVISEPKVKHLISVEQ